MGNGGAVCEDAVNVDAAKFSIINLYRLHDIYAVYVPIGPVVEPPDSEILPMQWIRHRLRRSNEYRVYHDACSQISQLKHFSGLTITTRSTPYMAPSVLEELALLTPVFTGARREAFQYFEAYARML